jgi:hypothetical protein
MDANKLTNAYVKLRDARKKLADEFNEVDGGLKQKQERLEAEMLRFMTESGVDSVRTPAGTFYRQENMFPSASDWEAFYSWIKKNDAFEALERRVKKGFVKEFMDANSGEVPPGISVHREYVARVRRA